MLTQGLTQVRAFPSDSWHFTSGSNKRKEKPQPKRRIHRGLARPFPDPPERDACGLPMAIWA